jgi:hypothetical protein
LLSVGLSPPRPRPPRAVSRQHPHPVIARGVAHRVSPACASVSAHRSLNPQQRFHCLFAMLLVVRGVAQHVLSSWVEDGAGEGRIGPHGWLAAWLPVCPLCLGVTRSRAGSVEVNGECVLCPTGKYNPLPARSGSCITCPAGTTNTNAGSVSLDTCVSCEVGQVVLTPGDQCTSCLAGWSSYAELTSSCYRCPAGQYGALVGPTNRGVCTPCSAGSFSPTEGATECIPAPGALRW